MLVISCYNHPTCAEDTALLESNRSAAQVPMDGQRCFLCPSFLSAHPEAQSEKLTEPFTGRLPFLIGDTLTELRNPGWNVCVQRCNSPYAWRRFYTTHPDFGHRGTTNDFRS